VPTDVRGQDRRAEPPPQPERLLQRLLGTPAAVESNKEAREQLAVLRSG
jgi:hypothetical protein